jgi:type IX secretion system PorP/SprF family membrane protein
MKKIVILIVLCVLFSELKAQQDPMFTHYMYNTIAVNPAYAGSREALTVTGLARNQWVGIKGAPVVQTLTFHSPIYNNKLGLGFSFMNDKIGPINNTSANVDFVYRIKLTPKAKLAFGIKGGINIRQNKLSSVALTQQNDASFQYDFRSELLPNFGFGMYYYTPKFYFGLSSPKLLENKFKAAPGSLALSSEKRHYFLITGCVVNLNEDFDIKPTILVKVVTGAPVEGDLSAELFYRNKFSIGVMYRTADGIGALVGFNVNEQFRIGYSYDWALTQLNKYNSGSHEIMLRYDFIYKDKSKLKSPRYF